MTHIPSKIKLSRALGVPLVPKAAKYMERRPYPPGQHGKSRRGKKSDYGLQLLEKQRLRHQYFLGERQMSNYVRKAASAKGITGDVLIHTLERRLDVLVLRAGFARTIYQARQFVTHGHVMLNGRMARYPSKQVRVGDEVSLKEMSRALDVRANTVTPVEPPPYVTRDGDRAWLSRLPAREEVPVICVLSSVVEYYAK
jgi:small subunit ribosomal protein S4